MYQIVKEKLIEEIEDAAPNTPIMSERELAETLEVSRMTARRAIQELVQEGYLYTNRNKGTFVADEKLRKIDIAGDVLEGHDTFKVVLFNMKTPNKQVAQKLEIGSADSCVRLVRVNYRNKKSVSVDEIYINTKYINNDKLEPVKFLEQFMETSEGMVVQKEFVPMIVPVQYANMLEVNLDIPIIKIEATYLSLQGRPYIYSNTYNHPERMKISTTN